MEHADAFDSAGFAIVPAVLAPLEVRELNANVDCLQSSSAGSRNLLILSWCGETVAKLRRHSMLAKYVPPGHVSVQCTLFEKDADRNWLVPFHQDLSIPVRRRVAEPSLTGWSEKEGTHFVHAPLTVLDEMVAVRLHLDPCGIDNGPLRVIPASHHAGRAANFEQLKSELGERTCLVDGGAAMVLKPLLLHASSKANVPNRRRVLHFVFGPAALPLGLEWSSTDTQLSS